MPEPLRTADSLTHAEKISIALGAIGDVEGLPAFVYTDGPNGVRDAPGATAFPSALVLAASFDLELAADYGRALGDEVRAAGRNVLLGPAADILRVPWAGRSAESFGEDPLLNGEFAGVTGAAVQSRGVLAIAKHFVANNFERLRTGTGSFPRRTPAVDVVVGERALREIYLEPFRRMLARHGVAGLMTSYNRLGGRYIAEDRARLELPRREWGFTGATFPDFLFAVRDPAAAVAAGLDLPGLDGASGRLAEHLDAEGVLDEIAAHVLASIAAVGLADAAPTGVLGGAPATALAERIVAEGAVLLANDGVLPLAPGARVALVAPADLRHVALTGGSAGVSWSADRVPSLAEELRRAGFEVDDVDAGDADIPLPTVSADQLAGPAVVVLRDEATGREVTRELPAVELHTPVADCGPEWTARVRLEFRPPAPGLYRFALDVAGEATLRVGSDERAGFREASPMIAGPSYPLQALALADDATIPIEIEFSTAAALDVPPLGLVPGFRLGWSAVSPGLTRAVEAASRAAVAIVVVGRVSGEAMDTDSLRLPAAQEETIRAVAAVASRTVVVTTGSGPIVMPWRSEVSAVLHLGHAGERLAPALAAVLSGALEPGGRLPYTIPAAESDVPLSPREYPGIDGRAEYTEGLEVGYRAYESRDIEPAFGFGHGLGYADLELEAPALARIADELVVTAVVRNVSARPGKFVAQLYVASPDSGSPRALRGFAVARPRPGEGAALEVRVPIADLRRYDEGSGEWVLEAGRYRLDLGSSSRITLWSASVDL